MSDDAQVTGQIAYAVDIYDASHALLVDGEGRLKVTGSGDSVTVTNFPPIQNVSIVSPVADDGDVLVTIDKYTYSDHTTLIRTPASLVPTVILPADDTRKNYTIYNDSPYALLVGFETPLSTAMFSVRIPRFSYFEPPLPQYSGDVYGVWEQAAIGGSLATSIF